METEKMKSRINKQIKYQSRTMRNYPMTKTQEKIEKKNNSIEKTKSNSPNQNQQKGKNLIKKNYIHSLLKSSSSSCVKETIKTSPPKPIINERKKNASRSSPKIKKNPFQNNFLQFQSSIKNNIQPKNKNKCIKRSNSFSNFSNKLNKDLVIRKPEKPAKTKKDLKIHPFLSRLSLKTLETVHENDEMEESEEYSSTTSASTKSLKEVKPYSLLSKYLSDCNKNIFKFLDKKKIIKKPIMKVASKIIVKNVNNCNNNNCNNNNNENYMNNNLNSNTYNCYINKNINNGNEYIYCHNRMNRSLDYVSKTYDYRNPKVVNENFNNCNYNNDSEKTVNFEDLIILEEKFRNIEQFLEQSNSYLVNKACLELWDFYFNCCIKGNLSKYFIDQKITNIIEESNTFFLFSLLIVYEFSLKPEYFCLCVKYMKEIIYLNNINFLLIVNNFLPLIQKGYLNNIWIIKLKSLISRKISNTQYYINQINRNMDKIYEIISIILRPHKFNMNIINNQLLEIYNNYSKYRHEELYRIFILDILKINNNGSILYTKIKNSYPKNNFILKKSPIKPLTLFIDLDETLISFVYSKENEGFSRIRPYLFQFLNLVKNYYECIIFTSSTRDYADPIIDVIEENRGTYFNHRLYRDNCTIYNNNYIKDISKFGRDLSKCIIVDNNLQSFKMQKENGILISSFWGDNAHDNSLLFLGRILVTIAMEIVESNYLIDVRELLFKYREDILGKISLK